VFDSATSLRVIQHASTLNRGTKIELTIDSQNAKEICTILFDMDSLLIASNISRINIKLNSTTEKSLIEKRYFFNLFEPTLISKLERIKNLKLHVISDTNSLLNPCSLPTFIESITSIDCLKISEYEDLKYLNKVADDGFVELTSRRLLFDISVINKLIELSTLKIIIGESIVLQFSDLPTVIEDNLEIYEFLISERVTIGPGIEINLGHRDIATEYPASIPLLQKSGSVSLIIPEDTNKKAPALIGISHESY
jgi:hypothetical protein